VRVVALTLGLAALVSWARPALAEKAYGAPLPDKVRQVEKGRFHSLQNWERTERWFRRVYGRSEGIVFRRLETTPKVEGWFIQNLRPGRMWDGIHVYRTDGTIHIFVLPTDEVR
jgi:hypothetical protein